MSFDNLGLSKKVLDAVVASGYTTPTDIQAQAIPHVLQRRDVLGIAQTGTGKTASFTLPMLSMLEAGRARARMPRTLILEPTRELAAQVEENFVKYGQNHKLSVALLIGGVSFDEQLRKLDRGVDVLIATPGRLLDHFERGKLLMTGVQILVIDEADRMLDMGFVPDIERICKMIPFTRQTLFFSATMPPVIEKLAAKFLQNPVEVKVATPSSTSKTITQRAVAVSKTDYEKRESLRSLIDEAEGLKNAIIFCNRKRDVADLWRSLERHKYSCGALHGDMDQRNRTTMLTNFREGKFDLLVASDVAARGLDIPDVSHIFNFDVPVNAEDYVHRIGRTGRAGRKGSAFMLVTPNDKKGFTAIEELIQETITWQGDEVEWQTRSGRGRGGDKASNSKNSSRRDAPKREPRNEKENKPSRKSEPDLSTNDNLNQENVAPRKVVERNPKPVRENKSAKKGPKSQPFGDEAGVPAFLLNGLK